MKTELEKFIEWLEGYNEFCYDNSKDLVFYSLNRLMKTKGGHITHNGFGLCVCLPLAQGFNLTTNLLGK